MTAVTAGADRPDDVGAADGRWLLAATGLASLLAGALHLLAALVHRDHAVLAGSVAAAGVLQVGWGLALVQRPARRLVSAGTVASGGFVVVYLLTRLVGMPIDGLGSAQPLDLLGACTALLGLAAMAGGVVWLRDPSAVHFGPRALAAVGAALVLVAVPAFAAGTDHDGRHDHVETAGHDGAAGGHPGEHAADDDGGEHDGSGHGDDQRGGGGHDEDEHGDAADGDHGPAAGHASGTAHGDAGAGHDGGAHVAAAHDPALHDPVADPAHAGHQPGVDPAAHPDHGAGGGGVPSGGGDHHGGGSGGTGGGGSGGAGYTPAQAAYLNSLLNSTVTSLSRFADPDVARAAGFTWIGDGGAAGGYQHWVNPGWFADGRTLDPNYPESLVYRNTGAGLALEAAMFMLPFGTSLATVPADIAWLPGWHVHDNLCFSGSTLVGVAVGGRCTRGSLLITPPMMHVWVVDTPCGRFAGVDEHGLQCHGH